MKDLKKLIEIASDGRIFIQTHNYPDPDAIASAFGLQKLLEHYGIKPTICYDGTAEKLSALTMLSNFGIEMVPISDIDDMCETDKIITVDAQKYNSNLTDLIGEEIACIDHHPTIFDCEYGYRDVRIVGACATLITEYFIDNHIPLERNVASALLYGIKMDTADFSRGVTHLDVQMYGKLFPHADNDLLDRMKINTLEFADLKAYGSAIESISVFENVGYAFIPFECPDALIAMISDFILALDVIEFSVVYAKRNDGYKFSVRSELPEYHAGKIIQYALQDIGSGGGHARMAGGFAKLPSGDDAYLSHEVHNLFEAAIQRYVNEG